MIVKYGLQILSNVGLLGAQPFIKILKRPHFRCVNNDSKQITGNHSLIIQRGGLFQEAPIETDILQPSNTSLKFFLANWHLDTLFVILVSLTLRAYPATKFSVLLILCWDLTYVQQLKVTIYEQGMQSNTSKWKTKTYNLHGYLCTLSEAWSCSPRLSVLWVYPYKK